MSKTKIKKKKSQLHEAKLSAFYTAFLKPKSDDFTECGFSNKVKLNYAMGAGAQ